MDLCSGCSLHGNEVCDVCKVLEPLKLDESLRAEVQPVFKIEGCLFPDEEAFLAQLARDCTGKGVIVELGSYLGRSTASLGIGSQLGLGTKIFTFDSYEGDSAMDTHPDMYRVLKENLYNAGVHTLVTPYFWRTDSPPPDFDEEVELLFIDADHSPPAVTEDFKAWVSKVVVGGKIAFHDTYDIVQRGVRFLGPLRVIRRACYGDPGFKILGRFQSITVVEKCKPEEVRKEAPQIVEPKPKVVTKTAAKKKK